MEQLAIHFLGTRGSVPVDADKYKIFGGATACTLIKTKTQNLILDAGSGFLSLEDYITINENTVLNILISHTHLDHIIGLLASKLMFNPKITVNIYGATRNGLTIKEQINTLMQAPIWPITTDYFTAKVNFLETTSEFFIDDFKFNVIEGNHTNGTSVYKITHQNKSILYATDFEINTSSINQLAVFAKDVDFMICDGQYCDECKNEKIGFGHSSWQDAVKTAQMANCKKLYIFHHDPYSTDEYLLKLEAALKQINQNYFFARKGEHLEL